MGLQMMSSQLSSEELLKQNARLTDELATCKNEVCLLSNFSSFSRFILDSRRLIIIKNPL